jgi:histidinol phosphatase-like enzyme (inositol monophosphatase family)
MSDELKVAIEAAKKGAENALKYFNKKIKTEIKKEDNTIVSHADRETEEIIKSHIASKYKSAKFVGEETGGEVSEKDFWVVDPIDGTRSFLRGIPNWCVIVSLCRDNDVFLGVIYFPHEDTIYYGQRNIGAFENNKKLHVSSISRLEEAYMGFGSPRHFKDKQVILDLIDKTASSRSWEATYAACLVVAGKIDLHIDAFGKIWDMAPFKVMIEEAGGKMTRLDGSQWTFDGSGALISNGILHDQILEIIGGRR